MIATTARNANLEDMVSMLRVQHDAKHDAVVPASAIHSVNGELWIDGMGLDGPAGMHGIFRSTDVFDEGLADKLRIPLAYVRRLRAERPDILDDTINGWLQGSKIGTDEIYDTDFDADPRRFLVRAFLDPEATRSKTGIARALLSDTYKTIDNLDVLSAALDGVRHAGVEAEVERCQLTDRRMVIDVVCPGVAVVARELLAGYRTPFTKDGPTPAGGWTLDRAREVAKHEGMGYEPGSEPIVWAGFQFSNSETGGGAYTLVPRLVVQACRNGLKFNGDMMRRVHLGAQLEEGAVRWSDATQQANLDLVTSMTADAITSWLNVEYVVGALDSLYERDKPIADPAAAVQLVASKLKFTEAATNGILDHFIRGGQVTAFGVAQAVTSYAQTVEDADVAYELENAAIPAFEAALA